MFSFNQWITSQGQIEEHVLQDMFEWLVSSARDVSKEIQWTCMSQHTSLQLSAPKFCVDFFRIDLILLPINWDRNQTWNFFGHNGVDSCG